MASRPGTWLANIDAVILLAFGVYVVVNRGDGVTDSLGLWSLSLFGSAALVLGGVLVRRSNISLGTALLVVGAVTSIVPTIRTVLMPLLGLTVALIALRDQARVP